MNLWWTKFSSFTLFALFWIHWLAASADRIITFKLDHYCLLLVCQCLTLSTHTRFQTFLPIFMLGLILRQPNRPNVVRTMFQFSSKVKIYQASCQVLCRSRQLIVTLEFDAIKQCGSFSIAPNMGEVLATLLKYEDWRTPMYAPGLKPADPENAVFREVGDFWEQKPGCIIIWNFNGKFLHSCFIAINCNLSLLAFG